ncbi:MAG: hypothetical protein HEQ35_24010 [Gloeotrichia echinulata IR180]
MWFKFPNKLSVKTSIATLFAISSFAIFNTTPALAELIFSTQNISRITPLETGSTTIGGLTVNADTSQWLQNNTQRLLGAQWQFNDDGTFVFYLPNTRTDLYPITGYYRVQGKKLSFQGSRTSNTQVSRAKSFVGGIIDFSQKPPVMNIQWGSSNINAAVVNGTNYGSNKTSAYDATVTLRRVK